MKTTKRFIAMTAALTLTACMAMPISMMTASAAGNVTITGVDTEVEHTFEAYQVFTGTAVSGKLSDLHWGSGVTKYKGTGVTAGDLVPSGTVSEVENLTPAELRDLLNSTTDATKITLASSTTYQATTKPSTTITDNAIFSSLPDGYYIIKDTTNLAGKDDANSAWIVDVVAGEAKSIAIKKDTPEVDKEVYDDADGGASGDWGEAADHSIGEEFQFKLEATIPANANLKAYKTYALTFNDTMSAGVTFDQIDSVTISSTTLTGASAIELDPEDYTENATVASNKAGLNWTLGISDIKAIVNANSADIFGTEPIKVEVLYTAHLNENAICSNVGGNNLNTNNNKVKLVYSNNPDNLGNGTSTTGETPDDYVWVFAYEVDNTKYHTAATTGNELQGATFKLYTDSSCADDKEYKLAWSTYANAYIPTSGTGSAMTSDNNGLFNIKGLDAGTYYLKEISAPDPYNIDTTVRTIVISATHGEAASNTAATLDLNGSSNMENAIVNTKNSTLPTTGGIGTTLFILGGGCAAGLAGIYLVSKKRAKEDAE